jgi:hypothetical protein
MGPRANLTPIILPIPAPGWLKTGVQKAKD